jgi:hypothetical protein
MNVWMVEETKETMAKSLEFNQMETKRKMMKQKNCILMPLNVQ